MINDSGIILKVIESQNKTAVIKSRVPRIFTIIVINKIIKKRVLNLTIYSYTRFSLNLSLNLLNICIVSLLSSFPFLSSSDNVTFSRFIAITFPLGT